MTQGPADVPGSSQNESRRSSGCRRAMPSSDRLHRQQVAKKAACRATCRGRSPPRSFALPPGLLGHVRAGTAPLVRAMADSPGSYEACKERGNRFFKARQYDRACAEYSTALTCASDDAQRAVALSNRALTWLEMGEHESAVADCTAALAVEPANVCMPSICGGDVAVRR
jgi:tetratricopeptide (TPR) repeat protein